MQVPLNGLTKFDSWTGTMGKQTNRKENHQMENETSKEFTKQLMQTIKKQDKEIKGLRTEIQKLNEMIDTNGQGEG